MFRSIRFRLAFWYTIVVALTFAVFAGAIYLHISRTLAVSLDEAIAAEAGWVTARYDQFVTTKEHPDAFKEAILEHSSFFPLKEYVEIWDSSGGMLYHSPNLGTDILASYATILPGTARSIETITRFRSHNLRLMWCRNRDARVILAMPMENILQPVRELANIFILLGPIVVLLAIAVGMGLAKTSFSKINKVIETAQNITAERLHDRIPEQETQDEIGKIITTFNAMISRLDISFNQMKQFSADASHELRTPLAVMRSQLEGALTSHATLSDLKKIAANCLDETLRLTNIVTDLLLLSRADAGRETLKREPVFLHELVSSTYEESAIIASQKSITVTLDANEKATILGEETHLRRMLLNLVDNAVKYNHDGGTISIALRTVGGMARITISDSGIGIPDGDVGRIFDRFYRVDRARSREVGGSGLGLSIVYWIVQAHGGTIDVQSGTNEGSKFVISLPLAPAH